MFLYLIKTKYKKILKINCIIFYRRSKMKFIYIKIKNLFKQKKYKRKIITTDIVKGTIQLTRQSLNLINKY